MAQMPSLSGLSLRSAPEPTAMISMPRAEQIDGRDRSEDEILREAYEYLLIRARAREAGMDDDNDWPPVYQSGFNMSFRGAHIDVDVWELMESEARAQAMREVELAVPKMTRTWTHGAPPKEGDEWAFQEEEPPKRARTGAAVPREPRELMGVEAASDVAVRTIADAFEADEMRHKPDPTGMPREKPVPKQRPTPYGRAPIEVDEAKVSEDMERLKQKFTTPIAVLMLGHAEDGPPNLATWYKWATETGRPGTKIFINHKMTGWSIPEEYAGTIVRLPYPEFEVRDTAWGRASLVQATLNMLVYAFDNGGSGFSHYAVVSEDTVPLHRASVYRRLVRLNPGESRIVKYNNEANRNQFVGMSEALVQWQANNPPDENGVQKRNWWVQEYARDAEIGPEGYHDVNEQKEELGMDDDGRMLDVNEDSYQVAEDWVDSFWNKRRVIGSEDGPTQEKADEDLAKWDEANPQEDEESESEEEEEEEEGMRYSYHEYRNPQQFYTHSQWMVLCKEDAEFCLQNIDTLRTMANDYDLLFGLDPDDEATPYSVHEVIAADEIVIGTFLVVHGLRPSANVLLAESGDGDHAALHPTVAALRAADQRSSNAMFGRKIQVRLQGNDIVTWE